MKRPRDHAAWIKARDKKLGADPVCEGCGDDRPEMLSCHHKRGYGISIRDHDQDNLQITCDRCHRKAHHKRDKDYYEGEDEQ